MGTRRGLTVLGAALLVLVSGGAGATADAVLSGKVGLLFGVGFVAGCLLAAGRVHQEDLAAVIVMPPLVYAALALLVGMFHPSSGGGSGPGLKNEAVDIASELVLKAPVLVMGTVVSATVAIRRAWRARAARRGAGGAHRGR